MLRQSEFSFVEPSRPTMPPTRFQGSKRKLAGWIADTIAHLSYETVLDVFGGTGSVSFELKRRGKTVIYNDVLRFNHLIGQALIENRAERLPGDLLEEILSDAPEPDADDFVERTFSGIYFTDDEDRWIDRTVHRIARVPDTYQRAIAFYALFQAALAKRPYNLFHRRNLYMRTANVERSFGNKTTWDKPFNLHFRRFADEANRAVFDNGQSCTALNHDALHIDAKCDLVYADPPYVSGKAVGVNYLDFYHFLEGLADYEGWPERIDGKSKHLKMIAKPDPWCRADEITGAFEALFRQHAGSVIVVSYRSDGIPTIDTLVEMLKRYKKTVSTAVLDDYQYVLSTNKKSKEVLIIAS